MTHKADAALEGGLLKWACGTESAFTAPPRAP